MASCVIRSCNCKQEYQDKKYGKNQRVHNPQQGKSNGKYRCTGCGTSKA